MLSGMISKEEAIERARAFLEAHQTGSIATASLDARPYSSTVYFAFLPDFTIFFTTSHHTAKFKNIEVNPSVSFSVGVGPDYRELVIHGHARVVTDSKEVDQGLAAITSRVTSPSDTWPVHAVKRLSDGGSALFRITPEEVSYLDLTGADQSDSASKYFYRLYP